MLMNFGIFKFKTMFLLDNSDDWIFKSNQETDGLGFRVFRVSNVIRKLMD